MISRPESPGDPTIGEWLSDFDVFVRQCGVPAGERAMVLVDYLGGCAKEEVLCHPYEVRRDFGTLVCLLRRMFGPRETVTSLYAEFYSRVQSVGETHAEFSRALIEYSAASTHRKRSTHGSRASCPGSPWRRAVMHQFVVGVRDEWVRHDLKRWMLRSADKHFIVVRGGGGALCLMCEEEASVVQMRPVKNAAPALSGPVGGSMSCVLDLDDIVLGDGGMSSCDVGRCVSVGDVSVSTGGDMELCGVDTVLSGVVSGDLCDLDRVPGGGDTDMSGVDTVLSGAVSGYMCDLDSLSRGDLVMRVGEMSFVRRW